MQSLCATVNWELKRESVEFSQSELCLMGRLDAPSIAPTQLVNLAKTYREACQMCWAYRRIKGMTKRHLAEQTGMYASHVTEYLSDDETQREMPAKFIKVFEAVTGNTAVSQWIAAQSQLTVMEQSIADRRAA
jgi:flagellar biosynthesis chaperone FliJ